MEANEQADAVAKLFPRFVQTDDTEEATDLCMKMLDTVEDSLSFARLMLVMARLGARVLRARLDASEDGDLRLSFEILDDSPSDATVDAIKTVTHYLKEENDEAFALVYRYADGSEESAEYAVDLLRLVRELFIGEHVEVD